MAVDLDMYHSVRSGEHASGWTLVVHNVTGPNRELIRCPVRLNRLRSKTNDELSIDGRLQIARYGVCMSASPDLSQ
jgi:hypothetical protein